MGNVEYYVDENGVLIVLLNGVEVGRDFVGFNMSEQGLHDIAYELLEEYGYL